MSDGARDRGGVVSLAVGLGMLAWISIVATQGLGRWPWVFFVILAAAPFLLLPSRLVQAAVRALVAGRAWRVWAIMAAAGAAGAALEFSSGTIAWTYIVLWPVCALLATWAAGVGESSQPTASRLLLLALPIWILAGVWDPRFQVRVPGTIDLGLAYFAALDMALFLLLVARPFKSLNAEYDLSLREAGTALLAVLALLVVALPVGYLVGFLHYNLRWISTTYAAGRLVGLVVFVGVPEELLFRGIIQEAFVRLWGQRNGWVSASVLFGLTHVVKHVPRLHFSGGTEHRFHELVAWIGVLNWRYALLATLAGLAYGWVYRRTGRLSAAALTHGLVDWAWGTFLLVP